MSRKHMIMIVDDNREFCENIKDVLEAQGHEVVIADDGFDAIEIMKEIQYRCSLVLLDLKMPVMNGVETLRVLRSLAPDTPFIAVSAFPDRYREDDLVECGAHMLLTKPLDMDQLLAIIADLPEQ